MSAVDGQHTTDKHLSAKPYIIGFLLSILLTVEAYILTLSHSFASSTIVALILVLAIVQLLVQLFFFLHLDRLTKTPWNIIMFILMAIVVATVVFGSLWIIHHLDYGHSHSAQQTKEYLKTNEDL
jgi:cytochrome o ubiquinol oxidase operon protein cyoD